MFRHPLIRCISSVVASGGIISTGSARRATRRWSAFQRRDVTMSAVRNAGHCSAGCRLYPQVDLVPILKGWLPPDIGRVECLTEPKTFGSAGPAAPMQCLVVRPSIPLTLSLSQVCLPLHMVPLAPKPHRADLKMGPVGPGKIAGPVLLHNKWAIFHHSCRGYISTYGGY